MVDEKVATPEATASLNTCPTCDRRTPRDFCPICGHPFPAEDAASASTDERDELSSAQQLLGVALNLNEAVYELVSQAQASDLLHRMVVAQRAAADDEDAEPLFAEVFDKIAEGVCNLFHAAGQPAQLEAFARAAERWVRGEA